MLDINTQKIMGKKKKGKFMKVENKRREGGGRGGGGGGGGGKTQS